MPRATKTPAPEPMNKPVQKFRIGYVCATVWKNDGVERPFYSVDIQRTYKDGEELKNTGSFNHADLMNVIRVAERAEAWIRGPIIPFPTAPSGAFFLVSVSSDLRRRWVFAACLSPDPTRGSRIGARLSGGALIALRLQALEAGDHLPACAFVEQHLDCIVERQRATVLLLKLGAVGQQVLISLFM